MTFNLKGIKAGNLFVYKWQKQAYNISDSVEINISLLFQCKN